MGGGEDGYSRAQLFEYTGRAHMVPEISVDFEYQKSHDDFWAIREMIANPDLAMTLDHICQWERHTYNRLQKFERDLVFTMDRAFRRARIDVLEFHGKRKSIKAEDRDTRRAK